MNKNEFIKNQQQLFNKQIEDVFDKEPFIIIFTDAIQSSTYGCHSYLTMYNSILTWRESLRMLFNGGLRYHGCTVNKWITYRCKCGCNSFYIWKHWYVCSECFTKHILNAENTLITFKDKEKCGSEYECEHRLRDEYDAKATIKWHKFGLISKFEFDEFMKNCTNPEQQVYFGYNCEQRSCVDGGDK